MSGHRKFSELTKKFTPEDWRKVEKIKAEMRETLKAESDEGENGLVKTKFMNTNTRYAYFYRPLTPQFRPE